MENDIEALAEQIKDAEQHLAELRKEYRELRTAGLRAAIDARNEADKVLREELKALGYRDPFRTQRLAQWINS
jgi:cell division septum initiation protein DivIVA|tara:strand:- start:172 stop:390 length:219 start_codon:yes stop_codon:yes gene_type:complete